MLWLVLGPVGIYLLSIGITLFAAMVLWWERRHAATPYSGPASEHYDGMAFHNPVGARARPWLLQAWIEPHARAALAPPPTPHMVERVEGTAVRVTALGGGTVLIQTQGINILIDPVWSTEVGPRGPWQRSRQQAPAVALEDLPTIHAVLLTHDHYDALDLPTLTRLGDRFAPVIVCPLGVESLLYGHHVSARVLRCDWWDVIELSNELAVQCLPAHHYSGRAVLDRNTTLWSGWALMAAQRCEVLYCGETGLSPHFADIRSAVGRPGVAVLPFARVARRLRAFHLSRTDVVHAHRVLAPISSLALPTDVFCGQAHNEVRIPFEKGPNSRESGIHLFTAGQVWEQKPRYAREAPRSEH